MITGLILTRFDGRVLIRLDYQRIISAHFGGQRGEPRPTPGPRAGARRIARGRARPAERIAAPFTVAARFGRAVGASLRLPRFRLPTFPAWRITTGSVARVVECHRLQRMRSTSARDRHGVVDPRPLAPFSAAATGASLTGPAGAAQARAVLIVAGIGDDRVKPAELCLARGTMVEGTAGVSAQRVGMVTPQAETRDFEAVVAVEGPVKRLADRHHAERVRAVPKAPEPARCLRKHLCSPAAKGGAPARV